MNDPSVVLVLHQALDVAARLAAPPLLASLATGLIISLLQAVTQINEASLVFLPKVVAVVGTVAIMGSFMFEALMLFAHHIFAAMIHVGAS